MGRKPIKSKAMTAAERQRRRRKKLRKETLKLGKRAEREARRLKAGKTYIPTPPGITYWAKNPAGDWTPKTRPLATMPWDDLTDEDLASLLEQAGEEQQRRKEKTVLAVQDALLAELQRSYPYPQALSDGTAKHLGVTRAQLEKAAAVLAKAGKVTLDRADGIILAAATTKKK